MQSRKSAPASLSPGKIVGHYVVQQQIGAGSGGVVYRAFDHRLQRAVALKVLDPSLLGEETTWALAISEARAAGSLAHPNICTVFDVLEEDDRVCLAMELVEGRSLHAAIPGHGLPCEATLRYGAQIASALAHAHDKGVCHGDVSARNVMLTLDDRVKVLDFGLARLLSNSNSPNEPAEGARRDLQQLGILLCQMATGVFPTEALDVLVGTAPPSAILESFAVTALPKGLRSVIILCLETDPARSYQRAQQTAADLEDELQLSDGRLVGHSRLLTWRKAALGAAALLLAALMIFIPHWVRDAHSVSATPAAAKASEDASSGKNSSPKPVATAKPETTHAASHIQEAAAKSHPAQRPPVPAIPNPKVWVNTKTNIYHCASSRFYGKTDQGKYMTQAQAQAAGYRPAQGKVCP
jgi:serine/threonine protein kinase